MNAYSIAVYAALVSEKDWFWATFAMIVIIIVVTGAAIAMI